MTGRKKSREELDRLALARHLLKLEPLGVLTREICYQPIPLEEECGFFGMGATKKWGILPPRLFYIPSCYTLVHCYGDDAFYELHPEYIKGGISKECFVLDKMPSFLSNYYAMEPTYQRVGLYAREDDPLSLAARSPPAMSATELKAYMKRYGAACKQAVKDRIAENTAKKNRVTRLRLVPKCTEDNGGSNGKGA